MYVNFFSALLTFFLFSCSSSAYREVDILDENFLKSKATFNTIEPDLVKNALAGYKSNLKLVKKCVDSVEEDFVRNFTEYKVIKKASPNFFNNYKICNQHIIFEQTQLNNLIHDIKNGFLSKDSINYYLTLEKGNIDQIISEINETQALYKLIKSNNDTFYTYVKRFAEKYCNK
jgi:hypothetical protein